MNYSWPWRGLGTTTKHEYLKSMNTLIIMTITAYFNFFGSFVFGICASLGEEKKLLRFSCVYININIWKWVNHFFIIKNVFSQEKNTNNQQIFRYDLQKSQQVGKFYTNNLELRSTEKSVYRWIHEYWLHWLRMNFSLKRQCVKFGSRKFGISWCVFATLSVCNGL